MAQRKLTTLQERMLIRYSDGESNLWEEIWVRFLLRTNNNSANRFLGELRQANQLANAWAKGQLPEEPVDLWDRIERRIAEEEYSSVFLGERILSNKAGDSAGVWGRVFNKSLFGGMAVGVATAALAFVALESSNSYSYSTRQLASSVNSADSVSASAHNVASGVEFVSYPDSAKLEERNRRSPYDVYRAQRNMRSLRRMEIPFEVDWMKSDGHVSFIQDPRKRSTVIWIKRDTKNSDRPVVLEAEPKLVGSAR